jgi:hypothetical protein
MDLKRAMAINMRRERYARSLTQEELAEGLVLAPAISAQSKERRSQQASRSWDGSPKPSESTHASYFAALGGGSLGATIRPQLAAKLIACLLWTSLSGSLRSLTYCAFIFVDGALHEQSALLEVRTYGKTAPEAGHANHRKTNSYAKAASQR